MHGKSRTPEETYGPALEKARKALPRLDIQRTAACAATPFLAGSDGCGVFHVQFFTSPYLVSWPEGSIRRMAGTARRAGHTVSEPVCIHYRTLYTCDVTSLPGIRSLACREP